MTWVKQMNHDPLFINEKSVLIRFSDFILILNYNRVRHRAKCIIVFNLRVRILELAQYRSMTWMTLEIDQTETEFS